MPDIYTCPQSRTIYKNGEALMYLSRTLQNETLAATPCELDSYSRLFTAWLNEKQPGNITEAK